MKTKTISGSIQFDLKADEIRKNFPFEVKARLNATVLAWLDGLFPIVIKSSQRPSKNDLWVLLENNHDAVEFKLRFG